jgi:hypothetical protein
VKPLSSLYINFLKEGKELYAKNNTDNPKAQDAR